MIAQVVASERAGAQTCLVTAKQGLQDYIIKIELDLNGMGKPAIEGDSPVRERREERQYPEQGGVGDAPFEFASTIW